MSTSLFEPRDRAHFAHPACLPSAGSRLARAALFFLAAAALHPIAVHAQASSPQAGSQDVSQYPPVNAGALRDGRHDFDFNLGTWKTHLKRRLRPLTGSNEWVEYEGTSVVSKVWNGAANLVELDVTGPTGRIEALSLRLYDPESRQWSLNFSNKAGGTMTAPTIGGFRDGRGVFYAQETLNGRAILVRFIVHDITPTSCRFEQAFSADGGKTWEVNWLATDTRPLAPRPRTD